MDTRVARIRDSTCGELRGHHNTNPWEFINRDAFAQIESGSVTESRGEVSVEGQPHNLELFITAASMVWSSLERATIFFVTPLRDASSKSNTAVVVNRYSDSAPVMLKYGRLQSQLMEKARCVKELPPTTSEGYTRYTTCTWNEWRQQHPHAKPRMGILELF